MTAGVGFLKLSGTNIKEIEMSHESGITNPEVTIQKALHEIHLALSGKHSKLVLVLTGIVYLVFYFGVTGLLTGASGTFSITISDAWPSLIFRERAPFNWEPIGSISLGVVTMFLAIPNILFGLIIAIFVGSNISVSYFTYKARKQCRINPSQSVLSAMPALLTGVACCGPTFLLSLGIASATLTVAFVSLLPILFPLALLGLIISLLWSGWRISKSNEVRD